MQEFHSGGRAGILNYVITDMLDSCFGPLSDAKYKDYNEAIGMLECCKLEFYRKAAAPYEDLKEKENGKVLDGETRKPPKPAEVKITPTEMMMTTPTKGYDKIIDPGIVELYNTGYNNERIIQQEKFGGYFVEDNTNGSITTTVIGNKTLVMENTSSLFNSNKVRTIEQIQNRIEDNLKDYLNIPKNEQLTGSLKLIYNENEE